MAIPGVGTCTSLEKVFVEDDIYIYTKKSPIVRDAWLGHSYTKHSFLSNLFRETKPRNTAQDNAAGGRCLLWGHGNSMFFFLRVCEMEMWVIVTTGGCCKEVQSAGRFQVFDRHETDPVRTEPTLFADQKYFGQIFLPTVCIPNVLKFSHIQLVEGKICTKPLQSDGKKPKSQWTSQQKGMTESSECCSIEIHWILPHHPQLLESSTRSNLQISVLLQMLTLQSSCCRES